MYVEYGFSSNAGTNSRVLSANHLDIRHKRILDIHLWLPSFFLTGEDEEAGAAGLTGGDCAIWSVLHPAAGETHLAQLGQGNSPPGSHLSHIQGTNVLLHYF